MIIGRNVRKIEIFGVGIIIIAKKFGYDVTESDVALKLRQLTRDIYGNLPEVTELIEKEEQRIIGLRESEGWDKEKYVKEITEALVK